MFRIVTCRSRVKMSQSKSKAEQRSDKFLKINREILITTPYFDWTLIPKFNFTNMETDCTTSHWGYYFWLRHELSSKSFSLSSNRRSKILCLVRKTYRILIMKTIKYYKHRITFKHFLLYCLGNYLYSTNLEIYICLLSGQKMWK